MRCPACKNSMVELKVLNLSADVCVGGCGGVWFDWYELKKIEEQHVARGVPLLLADCQEMDLAKERDCPRCESTTLVDSFASKRRDIQVEECPNCAGFFLARGELNRICEQTGSSPECVAAIARVLEDLREEGLASLAMDRVPGQSHTHGVARILRLILPNPRPSAPKY